MVRVHPLAFEDSLVVKLGIVAPLSRVQFPFFEYDSVGELDNPSDRLSENCGFETHQSRKDLK